MNLPLPQPKQFLLKPNYRQKILIEFSLRWEYWYLCLNTHHYKGILLYVTIQTCLISYIYVCVCVCVICCSVHGSVMCDSLWPHGVQPISLLCPWDFPSKNTRVVCHFLLHGIFPTQGLNLRLLHWQADSLPLSHLESGSKKKKYIYIYIQEKEYIKADIVTLLI